MEGSDKLYKSISKNMDGSRKVEKNVGKVFQNGVEGSDKGKPSLPKRMMFQKSSKKGR